MDNNCPWNNTFGVNFRTSVRNVVNVMEIPNMNDLYIAKLCSNLGVDETKTKH